MARTLLKAVAVLLAVCGLASADTLVMKDGTTHEGTLISATPTTISFRENGALQRYSRSSVDSIQFENSPQASAQDTPQLSERQNSTNNSEGSSSTSNRVSTPASSTASSNTSASSGSNMTLPAGTQIAVRTNDPIDSKTAEVGQTFSADVSDNVTNASGDVVIPKGSAAELILKNVSSGGTAGTSELSLDLQSVNVRGRRYTVSTQELAQKGNAGLGKNKRTAEMVGGGAVLGTLIGAIAGGGKGAAIGAVAGGATGAGAQVLTRGKSVNVPSETVLRFQLDQPLELHSSY